MSQLDSLTTFITENLPPDVMQMFESAMDDCQLERNSKALGLGQKRIGVLRYNAKLSWDRFPFRQCSPGVVYALVLTWINDHANEMHKTLQLPDPSVDPEFDDEGYCMLEVVVPVADEIILKPNENGAIPSQGQRWEVVYPEVWTATEAEFVTQHGDKS